MAYDSTEDTRSHINRVAHYLATIQEALFQRALCHDDSKFREPEKGMYDRLIPEIQKHPYGSPEYNQVRAQMGEALQHHYAHNSHHPEHYEDGISGMSLLDVVEMFCDWKAASERGKEGSLAKSIVLNWDRLETAELAQIFENTRKELGW